MCAHESEQAIFDDVHNDTCPAINVETLCLLIIEDNATLFPDDNRGRALYSLNSMKYEICTFGRVKESVGSIQEQKIDGE
jgi:hypothetical protein